MKATLDSPLHKEANFIFKHVTSLPICHSTLHTSHRPSTSATVIIMSFYVEDTDHSRSVAPASTVYDQASNIAPEIICVAGIMWAHPITHQRSRALPSNCFNHFNQQPRLPLFGTPDDSRYKIVSRVPSQDRTIPETMVSVSRDT